MNFYALSGLINAIAGTICGLIVYLQNPREHKNRISGLYFISITAWSYFYWAWLISSHETTALFFCRALMMGAIFIPVFQYHMTLAMYGLETPARKNILSVFYILTIIYVASNCTPLFIERVEPRLEFPFWPVPGIFFHFYLATFGASVLLSLLLIMEYRKTASPLIRNQILWFSLGILMGYGGGCTNFFLWYNIPIKPYLNIGAGGFIVLTMLSFFKLGLLDFRLFFRDTTVHFSTSLLIGGTCALLTYPIFMNNGVALVLVALSLAVPHLYQPIYRRIKHRIRLTKWGGVDQYLGMLDTNIDRLRETTFTYDDLANNLVQAVLNTFPVEMAAVYFVDNDSKEFQLRAQRGLKNPLAGDLRYNRSSLSLKISNPLIAFLRANKNIVDREVIEAVPIKSDVETGMLDAFQQLEGEVVVPFLLGDAVKGFLVLGKKKNGELFHKEDLMAVEAYRRMGEDVMRYIMGMEYEVRHAALYSHDMNNDTKALVQTLQFIQSPLGQKAKPERIKTMMEQAEEVAIRLNQSFQLNRDRSALILKSIKGDYERPDSDLVKLMKESVGKFMLRAEEAKINLRIDVPKEPLVVHANANDFVRVIDNLVSNALRYVKPDGLVAVTGYKTIGRFTITVADNGAGIPPDIIEHIWDFGWQVKDAKQGASGLGLSLVKQIVQLHGWSIKVESGERGKGTRFIITVPMQNKASQDAAQTKKEAA